MWKDAQEKAHDQMVQYVAKHLKKRFYQNIRAKAEGFQMPESIEVSGPNARLVPDVTMVAKGSRLHILEVETSETLSRAETARKWSDLARHAEERNARLWVVLPKGARESAEGTLRELKLSAEIWEV